MIGGEKCRDSAAAFSTQDMLRNRTAEMTMKVVRAPRLMAVVHKPMPSVVWTLPTWSMAAMLKAIQDVVSNAMMLVTRQMRPVRLRMPMAFASVPMLRTKKKRAMAMSITHTIMLHAPSINSPAACLNGSKLFAGIAPGPVGSCEPMPAINVRMLACPGIGGGHATMEQGANSV